MSKNQEEMLIGTDWTALNTEYTDKVVFQVLSGALYVRATSNNSPPSPSLGFIFDVGEGSLDRDLSELFPAMEVSRLWARAVPDVGSRAVVMVSYA